MSVDDELVYMDCTIKMSNRQMADLMYAILKTDSQLVCSYGHTINDYTRKQNGHYPIDIKIKIHPNKIKLFEVYAETKLSVPQSTLTIPHL